MDKKPKHAKRNTWDVKTLEHLEKVIGTKPIEEVAEEFKTSVGSIKAVCSQHGISRRSKKVLDYNPYAFYKQENEELYYVTRG